MRTMINNIWKVVKILNWVGIILVVWYSSEITMFLNSYTTNLNALEDNITESGHMLRWFMNKWTGISLAGNLILIFFIRKGVGILTGAYDKIATRRNNE